MQRNHDPTARADSRWRMLYRIGGISAGLSVAMLPAATVLVIATPPPPTAGGAATLEYVASHRTLYIVRQQLWLVPGVFAAVMYLALYPVLKWSTSLRERRAPSRSWRVRPSSCWPARTTRGSPCVARLAACSSFCESDIGGRGARPRAATAPVWHGITIATARWLMWMAGPGSDLNVRGRVGRTVCQEWPSSWARYCRAASDG
jgi:hypothetical protein